MQVYYLTQRFAQHAQRWQFVIWLRQFLLIVVIVTLNAITQQLSTSASGIGLLRYPAAFVALLIIFVSLALHLGTNPYVYRTQNSLESFLMISNVVFMISAIIFQACIDSIVIVDANGMIVEGEEREQRVRKQVGVVVLEIFMIGCLTSGAL